LTSPSNPIKTAIASCLADAHGKPEATSDILEALCTGISMCIQVMAKGNPALANELTEGATAYIYERTTGFAKFGEFMARPQMKVKRRF
jgi:hypothetical protein